MPRKIREVRKGALNDLDNAVQYCPPHVRDRLGKPLPIGEALRTDGEVLWNGSKFDPDGHAVRDENRAKGRLIASQNKTTKALREAGELSDKYGDLLNRRGGPTRIAEITGIPYKTVLRARDRLTN